MLNDEIQFCVRLKLSREIAPDNDNNNFGNLHLIYLSAFVEQQIFDISQRLQKKIRQVKKVKTKCTIE